MRVSWTLLLSLVATVVFAAAVTGAVPIEQDEQSESSGSKTWSAIKGFFRPMTDYFTKDLPQKTPSEVADDVKDKVSDAKEWMQENEAVQGLVSALRPVKTWIKDTASTLKDKSFQDMFEDVKDRVAKIDQSLGTWIERKTEADTIE